MSWWKRKSQKPDAQEDGLASMERADKAMDEVSEAQIESRSALFYLRQEAAKNHFSADFIAMVERGRP